MSLTRVFTGTLQPSLYSLSDVIGDALAFYIVAPDDVSEVAIDVFLQVEISLTENRQVLLHEEKRTETDTTLFVPIPVEYAYSNSIKRFALYSSFSVNIEVWCLYADYTLDSATIDEILLRVQNLETVATTDLFATAGLITNQIAQNTALGILAASLGPITLGTSLAAEPPLLTGTSTIAPILLLLP